MKTTIEQREKHRWMMSVKAEPFIGPQQLTDLLDDFAELAATQAALVKLFETARGSEAMLNGALDGSLMEYLRAKAAIEKVGK